MYMWNQVVRVRIYIDVFLTYVYKWISVHVLTSIVNINVIGVHLCCEYHLRMLKYDRAIGKTYIQIERVWLGPRYNRNCQRSRDRGGLRNYTREVYTQNLLTEDYWWRDTLCIYIGLTEPGNQGMWYVPDTSIRCHCWRGSSASRSY